MARRDDYDRVEGTTELQKKALSKLTEAVGTMMAAGFDHEQIIAEAEAIYAENLDYSGMAPPVESPKDDESTGGYLARQAEREASVFRGGGGLG